MALLAGAMALPGICALRPDVLRFSSSSSEVSVRTNRGFGRTQFPCLTKSVGARRHVVRAATSGNGTEKRFKTTVELDKLIDTLRETEYEKLPQIVAENVLGFNTDFWLRLAARADLATSPDDQRDYEVLASNIMNLVELIVRKTQEKIESSTDILKSILVPLIEDVDGEISWPPRNPESISMMRKEVERREDGGYLDESFLSEVSAQLRQATEDGDKPGLVAILQKVLQLYASTVLSRRTYSVKGDQVDKAEELLEKLIAGDEENWNELLRAGLVFGGGSVESNDLFRVVEKRVERTLMRTENGSYQQRLLVEYVREIQTRTELLVEAFQTSRP
ncbi:hypothetical protein AXG93_3719s1370 [Marchantia polymorpha subsp. ruderalis]|nr:hypothetical protein AXG93_3719s1370 [Marchantia polymorpha subsp. ruderalis]